MIQKIEYLIHKSSIIFFYLYFEITKGNRELAPSFCQKLITVEKIKLSTTLLQININHNNLNKDNIQGLAQLNNRSIQMHSFPFTSIRTVLPYEIRFLNPITMKSLYTCIICAMIHIQIQCYQVTLQRYQYNN